MSAYLPQCASAGPVVALAWHPNGHLLAAAVHHRPGFTIFDISTGISTPVSAGAITCSSRPSCAAVLQEPTDPVWKA